MAELFKILVYDDEGASHVDTFVKALDFSFSYLRSARKIEDYLIKRVSGADVIKGLCFQEAKLFVMPGGRDLPYIQKLKGQGIANIKHFVIDGGNYLGVCAGAYFASSFCEFEKGEEIEVCGKRDLKFFPGVARGSVYPGFQYDSEVGARIVQVQLEDSLQKTGNNRTLHAYHNGGCEFILEDGATSANIQIVGRYAEFPNKIAIVLCKHEKGKALLSGLHPEINYNYLTDKSKYSSVQLNSLSKVSEEQQDLLQTLLLLIT